MKKSLALLGGLVLAAGSLHAQTDYDNLSSSRSKKPPLVGMTKAEAKSRYGEPFNQWKVAGGERWLYRLKFDEVYGRAYVPFFTGSDNLRVGTLDFGPDDRVKTYDWQRTMPRS